MQVRDQLYIGGQWAAPKTGKSIDVINASTEEIMGRIPEGTEDDVNAAVAAARAAFDGWAARPAAERAAFLQKIHEGLKARVEEIGKLIAAEVGMPVKLATMIQAGSPAATFGMYAKMLGTFAFEEQIGNSLVLREPVGVVAAITPWNYPLHQIAAKVAPALAAGCTVVLKPSEVAPLNAFVLAEIVHAAGLPAGVFNLVTGYGPVVGEAMARHPDVDMVSFTGSTRAGKRVSELASATVKRVALELGGKSAAVVLDDADLAAAVKGTVNACFLNSGQTCSAHTRLLVPESKYDEAAKIAVEVAKEFTVGDPFGGAAKLGPLVSELQRERVRGYIKKGIEGGAELLCGGPDTPAGLPKGYYVKPTVFGRVKPDTIIAQEEIFGPVLCIITYKDEDEAISIVNGTAYGLGGGVWSKNEERAKKVAKRMRTGQVGINGGPFNLQAPFGGFKQSGNGRELGRFGLEQFLEYKSLQLKPEARSENPMTFKYHWEDFVPGRVFETVTRTLSEEDIVRFAREYDPQSYHTDAEAARASPFGGLIASGWQTCAVLMRLMCDGYLLDSSCVGSPGLEELRWLKPVRPGDTLRLKTTVIESTPSGKQPNRGTVLFRWEMLNQNGEVALSMRGRQLYLRRAPA